MANLINFKIFCEAWANRIKGGKGEKRDPAVSTNKTYSSASGFIKNSEHIGNIENLELHSANTAGGGMTHFTYNPKDKKIHHILYAASSEKDDDGITLKYLSAHARKTSPVRMSQVYSSLIKDHGRTLVGTSHSVGAKKVWDRMLSDPEIQIHGHLQSGKKIKLNPGDQTHAPYDAKTPEEKRIGNMTLVAQKAKSL